MNKDQLHNYLNKQFDEESMVELEKLVETYPYFQGARILLSQVSSNQGHHAFESHLKKAAIHSGSREALFNEVMGERIQFKVAAIEKEIEELNDEEVAIGESDVVSEEITEKNEEPVEQIELVQEAEISEVEVKEEEKEELLSELMVATGGDDRSDELESEEAKEGSNNEEGVTLNELDLIEEELESEINVKEDVDRFKSMDELSQGVLIGAISRSLELEVTPKQSIAKVEEEEIKEDQVQDFGNSGAGSSVNAFTQWVYQRAIEMNYISQTEVAEQNAALHVEDLQGKDKSELIDRFIAFEPKITRGKAGEFNTPEQAAEALLEDDAWVTETLAAIYAKQGNIGKAKKAYKLLSLKFPEKSIYFANQIKKLGSQPNTKK